MVLFSTVVDISNVHDIRSSGASPQTDEARLNISKVKSVFCKI